MGTIIHHAIVVTCQTASDARRVHEKALSIFGDRILSPVQSTRNGYYTLLIPPDGSKMGWDEQQAGAKRRVEFKRWLRRLNLREEDVGFSQLEMHVHWVEVVYGEVHTDEPFVATSDMHWSTEED